MSLRSRFAPLSLALAGTFACAEPASPPTPAPPARVEPAKPRLIAAPEAGDVATVVREEAAREGGTLVVTVGADWCEPCRAFHDAVQSGQLDAQLMGVRFFEFDIDRDRARLEAAGYKSRFLPLFALPDAEGRASGKQIEGGIKGPRAVEHIMARLGPLVKSP
ncbi:TlpA family protein disulfide reductase [Nannocystis bainbridge]|uniref:Thioredoxin family protein n=1 Tax=Nannocystis bainbridge TaxID=2995303 RepID=A0ABT5E1L1_9BACT|nr:thioredoxin family protein [Nannocystis bainbridge]MDC0719676.1 thioredoxin family protein [Nannocystis bainbridge]